jgi:hypothetical protein
MQVYSSPDSDQREDQLEIAGLNHSDGDDQQDTGEQQADGQTQPMECSYQQLDLRIDRCRGTHHVGDIPPAEPMRTVRHIAAIKSADLIS